MKNGTTTKDIRCNAKLKAVLIEMYNQGKHYILTTPHNLSSIIGGYDFPDNKQVVLYKPIINTSFRSGKKRRFIDLLPIKTWNSENSQTVVKCNIIFTNKSN